MTPQPTTPEAKLAAIIKAQGITHAWSFEEWTLDADDSAIVIHQEFGDDKPHDVRCGILEILLDPAGLKAAYGEDLAAACEHGIPTNPPTDYKVRTWKANYEVVATRILAAWLSGGSEAAIQTAYDLLPKP